MPVYVYVLIGAALALLVLSILMPTTRRLWVFTLVLAKHLWFKLGDLIGIRRLVIALQGKTYRPYTNPVMARRIAEDLGPTFIKFGQIVASSSGMFPKPFVIECQK